VQQLLLAVVLAVAAVVVAAVLRRRQRPAAPTQPRYRVPGERLMARLVFGRRPTGVERFQVFNGDDVCGVGTKRPIETPTWRNIVTCRIQRDSAACESIKPRPSDQESPESAKAAHVGENPNLITVQGSSSAIPCLEA
jgi:hypothetical protein